MEGLYIGKYAKQSIGHIQVKKITKELINYFSEKV